MSGLSGGERELYRLVISQLSNDYHVRILT
jgi:hypothetical protein